MQRILLMLVLFISCAVPAHASLRIVATLPWIGSLARDIGRDKVEVTVLVKPAQDPHSIEAKPSMIATARRADLIAYNGLDLEVGYLPILVESSRNPAIQAGKSGNLNCSIFIEAIEKMPGVDRSHGDVHPLGNPHYHLSPANVRRVALGMAERLATLAPQDAAFFRRNAADFVTRLDNRQKIWKNKGLKGQQYVAGHKFFEYLATDYGFRITGYLEPKPGIPPTSAHLNSLISAMKAAHPKAILTTAYESRHEAAFVSSRTGVKNVQVPHDVGAGGTKDWFELMDAIIKALE
jgi:zinc/manganese transport system substrate-binding protein